MTIREFFFENKNIKQILIKNTFWYSLSQFTSIAIKSFFIIWIARFFSIEEYGRFNFAMSFATLFMIFSDLGVAQILLREVAQENVNEKKLNSFFTLKLLLSLGAGLLAIAISLFLNLDFYLLRAVWAFSLYSSLYAFLGFFYYYYLGKNRTEYLGWGDLGISILTVVLGAVALYLHPTVFGISLVYLAVMLCTVGIFAMVFISNVQKLQFDYSEEVEEILKISAPLAFVSFCAAIYSNIDSTVMGIYGKFVDNGYYSSAMKIITVSIMPAGLIASVFAPNVHKFFKESKELMQKVFNLEIEAMVFLSMGVLFGGWVLAPNLMGAAYVGKYDIAIPALQLLLFTSVVFYFLNPLSQTLIAAQKERHVVGPYVWIAFINIALDFLWIPVHGFMGAVYASIAALVIGLISLGFNVYSEKIIDLFSFNTLSAFGCAALSAMAMIWVIKQVLPLSNNIFILVGSGGLVYLSIYAILRLGIFKNYFIKI